MGGVGAACQARRWDVGWELGVVVAAGATFLLKSPKLRNPLRSLHSPRKWQVPVPTRLRYRPCGMDYAAWTLYHSSTGGYSGMPRSDISFPSGTSAPRQSSASLHCNPFATSPQPFHSLSQHVHNFCPPPPLPPPPPKEGEGGHKVVRGRWAPPPTDAKDSTERQR